MRWSKEDLLEVTGTSQTAAQVRWFKKNLGANVPFDSLGVIMNEKIFDALLKKSCGLPLEVPVDQALPRPNLNLGGARHGT